MLEFESFLKSKGFNLETLFYRYTYRKHLHEKDGKLFIQAKGHPIEIIEDHYETGELVNAYKINKGLGFCTTPHNYHKREGKICVGTTLNSIAKQNGKIYKEMSSSTPDAWFVTIPEGELEIELIDR